MEPEVIVVQYGRGCWTRGQKFALIRTVCQLWAVVRAYVLLDRTGNGFHIKISVLLNQSKPALVQTQ